MKKVFILAALAATALLASCNNNAITPDVPAVKGDKVAITLNLGGNAVTKADDVQTTDEAKVNSWKLWVYNEDGTIDAFKEVSSGNSVQVDVTEGTKTFQVVVNAPASLGLTSAKTEAEVLASVSSLSDNTASSFVMVGSEDAAITSESKDVTVEVDRVAARIVIKKITNALNSGAAMKIAAIYVTNVAGDCDLGFSDSYTITNWYDKMGIYEASNPNAFDSPASFVLATPAANVANNASYSTANTFYVYPNSNPVVNGGEWSPRASKLVIKATVGDDTFYYPVELPSIVNNHSYEINELIITRNGNTPDDDDPEDTPISSEQGEVTIDVQDWNVVLVGDDSGVVTI